MLLRFCRVAILLGAVILSASCYDGIAGARVVHRRDRQELIRALAGHRLILPVSQRLCFRLPERGPEAVVVVRAEAFVRNARRLLGTERVVGRVEVRRSVQYEHFITRLARVIESEVPEAFRGTIHVSGEVIPGHFECLKARIELGLQSEAPQAAVEWAQAEVQRYGADLVIYRFARPGVAL
jgi:hypothetical protein